MIGPNRLSIQSKLIVLLLVVSLSAIAVMGWIGYATARGALAQSAQHQLQGVRFAKTRTLETLLESLRGQVLALSDSKSTIEAMRAFSDAYRALGTRPLDADAGSRLEAFYRERFLPELGRHSQGVPVPEQYLPTRAAERWLQYHYLAANPNAYGQGQGLASAAADATAYGQAHAAWHPAFARAVRLYGFADVLLVDADTLDVVYSYRKTTELGTSLATGPYAGSQLAEQVRALRDQKERDDFRMTDFAPYPPALGQPMGFAMSTIYDGHRLLGILVVQVPMDRFNAVLSGNATWREEGFGESGECYLVGPDLTMRSETRFMRDYRGDFIASLRNSPTPTEIVDEIERRDTVMSLLPVDTRSVREALKGHSGIATIIDYRGEPVLSAYGPLEFDSMRWAVIAELDEQEAQAPILAYGRKVVMVATATALLVTLIALLAAQVLTAPLRRLTAAARRLGAGETEVQVRVASHDEFGELAQVFNDMAGNIRRQQEQLRAQVQENQDLLFSILPAAAVARRQEGDPKANREFADVTVLFADILGMEEFSTRIGEARSLEVLGDLIEAFDDAAEASGIEKVRTIGASYLAVCGLSVSRPDHTRRVVAFALDLLRIVGIFNRDHRAGLILAVGVNCGPVVGGVVGRRKFLYDLWGHTVSIARRLAGGQGGGIHVSAAVAERLAGQFQLSGPVAVDGDREGSVEYWEVTAPGS